MLNFNLFFIDIDCGLLPRFLHSLNKWNILFYIITFSFKIMEVSMRFTQAKDFYFGNYGISSLDWTSAEDLKTDHSAEINFRVCMTYVGIFLIYGNAFTNSIFLYLDIKSNWEVLNYSGNLKAPAGNEKLIKMEIVGRNSDNMAKNIMIRRPSLVTTESMGSELISLMANDNN